VAKAKGKDLLVECEDGTRITLVDYMTECRDGVCDLILPGDDYPLAWAQLQGAADASAAAAAPANLGGQVAALDSSTPITAVKAASNDNGMLLGVAGAALGGLALGGGGGGSSGGSTPQQNPTLVRDTALEKIRAAAESNNAQDDTIGLTVYSDAGVTGVTSANLSAVNSAINSTFVNGARADTTAEVQAIVDAYNRILSGADSNAANNNAPINAAD
jgi:hypothetical protein